MNKEIILFVYDYEQYVNGSYGLEDYDKYFQGVKAHNFEELCIIMKSKQDCHLSKETRDFIMDFYWGEMDNGLDIVNEIKNRIAAQ